YHLLRDLCRLSGRHHLSNLYALRYYMNEEITTNPTENHQDIERSLTLNPNNRLATARHAFYLQECVAQYDAAYEAHMRSAVLEPEGDQNVFLALYSAAFCLFMAYQESKNNGGTQDIAQVRESIRNLYQRGLDAEEHNSRMGAFRAPGEK